MTTPQPIGLQHIGAMSSSQVILGELLSSRARLRFPGHAQAQPSTPVRKENPSERQTGLLLPVSLKGVTLMGKTRVSSPQTAQVSHPIGNSRGITLRSIW
jgi:hypothetical protein